jgi:sensor c-di-GMP phosphodiesterase-like protein
MFSMEEIRASLNANEFFLQYMPTISLTDNRCVGAEALIRWQYGARVVQPLEFVPLIENTPLSGSLTYWVIETVANELGTWMRSHDGIHISVNVPPELLGRGGLLYAAKKAMLHDVAGKLMLEVTERGLPDALGVAAIAEAARGGVLIALDDLDLSEANLVVLSRIHTDVVKFDKSFVDRMLEPEWRHQHVDGLTALIHTAGFNVIVEGVETKVQCDILKDAGIQMAQGFFFSKPLLATDFINYFAAHQ